MLNRNEPNVTWPEQAVERGVRFDLSLLNRSVRVRAVYAESMVEQETVIQGLRIVARAGEEIRVSSTIPAELGICDDAVASIELVLSFGYVLFVLRQPELIALLRSSFENVWNQGKSVESVLRSSHLPEPAWAEKLAGELSSEVAPRTPPPHLKKGDGKTGGKSGGRQKQRN